MLEVDRKEVGSLHVAKALDGRVYGINVPKNFGKLLREAGERSSQVQP